MRLVARYLFLKIEIGSYVLGTLGDELSLGIQICEID